MAAAMESPVTSKETSEDHDKRVMYGCSCMQGWRQTMEDAHTTLTSYGETGASFFGVFDGHGGDKVAKFCGSELYKKIMDAPAFERGRYRDAIRSGYYGIDQDLKKELAEDEDMKHKVGSTALTAILTKNNVLYVSNAGDSRAVISTRDGKAIALSTDHKPRRRSEEDRIKNAGGSVDMGRVNGSLALSRAIGDFRFKLNPSLTPDLQIVTAEPEITEHLMTDLDEFVVLACDGIWDCLTDQQVIDFIRNKLCEEMSLGAICEALMDYCLSDSALSRKNHGIGCDNMTVVIVAFLRKKTPEQWYHWMARKPCPDLPRRFGIFNENDEYIGRTFKN